MTPATAPPRMARRALIMGGLALAATPAMALATPSGPAVAPLAFDIFRKGRKIGEHTLSFEAQDDGLTMDAHVQMAVAVGPVTLFRYRHQQTETWKGGRFWRLQTSTVQNGDHIAVTAERTEAGVRLQGGKHPEVRMLGPTALPLTHWNRASLSGPLFNPQDGKMMRLAIAGQGPAPVMLGNGQQITATRVALAGETSIEDWYDPAGAWTGLRARAMDGSVVEYRRV